MTFYYKINDFLLKCVKKKEINYLDFYFSNLFVLDKNKCYVAMLFSSLLSLSCRLGHVCIPLNEIFSKKIFSDYILNFLYFFFSKCLSIDNCIKVLLSKNIISTPEQNLYTPFIIYNNCLYLYKFWLYENYVISYINKNIKEYINFNKNDFFIINKYLNDFNLDKYQKLAIINSLVNKISIISGEPGTGKTSLIVKLIIIFYKVFKYKYKDCIKIISPTGKSSLCLTNYLNNIYNNLNISFSFRKILPDYSITIHKFLGFNYFSNNINFNINKYSNLDVLIIDESSMVDLYTMFYIFFLIKDIKKIIFVGDSNQIGSIEPCSVFNEICNCNNYPFLFSYKKKNILKNILSILKIDKLYFNYIKFTNSICFLNKNYRLFKDTCINKLFILVKLGYLDKIDEFLYKNNFNKNFNFYDANKFKYNYILNFCINNYKKYIYFFNKNLNNKNLLNIFNLFKIITVLKSNNYISVIYINKFINNFLLMNNLVKNIFFDYKNNCYHYDGEPIMVTKNNNDLKIFNGDTGFLISINKKNKVIFFDLNNKCKYIHLNSLINWKNNWSITVHKSQGSEYEHVLLILPDFFSSLLNRELIYTSLTRAKKKITIYAKKEIFLYSIKNKNKIFNNFLVKLFVY